MGIILPQMVDIPITAGNVNHLLSKGYTIPTHRSKWKYKKDGYTSYNLGDTISVSVNHLAPHSHVKVKCICDDCGIIFERVMAEYTRQSKNGISLCASCSVTGKRSSLYKENLSESVRVKRRNYHEYNAFRKKVYDRDKYTCQCCGADNKHIELHHLNSYSSCEDGRTDMDNAITLCHDCHTAFHNEYGKGENTKEQFFEWMRIVHNERVYDGKIIPYRPVYCFENDKLYQSPQECASECGIKNVSRLYEICNQAETTYSLCGKHFMWGDVYQKMNDSEVERYFHYAFTNPQKKKVVCLGDLSIYMSATEAGNHYGLSSHKVVLNSCDKKHGKRSLGILPNGKPITFAYYDDFVNMSESDIEMINSTVIKDKLRKKVINIITNTVYNTQRDAYSSGLISNFLLKKYCDEAKNGDISHGWMYYEDYLKLNQQT